MNATTISRHFRLVCICLTAFSSAVYAEVEFDGTLGPGGTLSGTFDIPDSFGMQVGGNLFHSFTTFNINTGESATFTSSYTGMTNNVIGRVTGTSVSTIDGTLASTIPNAAIWLINPNGVIFGDNATLSVPGAFHVGTADYLLMEDGGQFDATNLGNTVLTMADPSTFGFLDASPAPISVGASTLSVSSGSDFSFVGGDLTLTNSTINAPGGRMNIASVAGAGDVSMDPNGIGVGGITDFGDINLNTSTLSTLSNSGGDVFIRGGQFVMDAESVIESDATGLNPADAGGDIEFDIVDMQLLNSSQVRAAGDGAGRSGNISVRASGDVLIQGDTAGFPSGLFSNSREMGTGSTGDILVSAANLSIIEGGAITANTFGSGSAGNIIIDVTDTIFMRSSPLLYDADILANANSFFGGTGSGGMIEITATDVTMELGALIQAQTIDGLGGDLTINSDTLTLTGSSQLSSATFGSGDGSSLIINSRSVDISGFQFVPGFGFFVSGLFAGTSGAGNGGAIDINSSDLILSNFALIGANAASTSSGLGGQVDVDTDRLDIRFGAFISAGSFGSGESGSVDINATESILIDGQFLTFPNFTGIFANTFGNGSAGTITVTTPDLTVRDGGFIQAGSFSGDPFAIGNARDILINVDNLLLDAGFISATTYTNGNAGVITVNASGAITMQNTSGHVFTAGNNPIGGILAESGSIFTSNETTGTAGDIILNANEVMILDGGSMLAQTRTAGDAGNIFINADSFDAHSDASIFTVISNNTAIGTGNAGSIFFDVNDMTVSGLATIQAATLGFGGTGNGGVIDVSANSLTVADGGSITTLTQSVGNAGSVQINVNGTFSATGGNQNPLGFGNVSSASFGNGDGGTLRIAADNVVIGENGVISVSATADGSGGDLFVEGRVIDIIDGGTISAGATGSGNAGTIILVAVDNLNVNNASIETSSDVSAGGNISIGGGGTLFLNDGGSISAAAAGVTLTDGGGNITINDTLFVILRNSDILATANAGNGGNIDIRTDSFLIDAFSGIDASSRTGLDGRIRIDTVNNIYGSVLILEAPSITVPNVITRRCVAAAFRDRSSLTVNQRPNSGWSAEDYLASPFEADDATDGYVASSTAPCRLSLTVEGVGDGP